MAVVPSKFLNAAASLALLITSPARAEDAAHRKLYDEKIHAKIDRYCYKCHGNDKQKGDLNLASQANYDDIVKNPKLWADILERIFAFEMPPEGSPGPEFDERNEILDWLRKLPKEELDCSKLASDRTQSFYAGHVMSRRITRDEYRNSIRDLTGLSIDAASNLPADGAGGEGFDTTGDTLFTSTLAIEKYLDAAELVMAALLPDSPDAMPAPDAAARASLLGDLPNDALPPRNAARKVLDRFLPRAFRRPAHPGEPEKYLAAFDRAIARGDRYDLAVRLMLTGIIVSPHFLFLAEPEPAQPGIQPLSPFALASRLSYFLWASMPDDILFQKASSGDLLKDDVYLAEIRRLLADPRAASLGHRFASQWLDLDRVGTDIKADGSRFPEFTPALAASMRGEVITFFNHLIRENQPLTDLIDCNYSFINAPLAALYGIPDISGDSFQKVTFPSRQRGGLTGMAAIHTATSFPLRTSPVLRGKWLLDTVLGERVPPPPPNVPPLKEEAATSSAASVRQQLEEHRRNPDCAACHNRMDPLGFGMESFDVIGRLRTDNVDASGKLPSGESFNGPEGLKDILLARKDQIIRHLVRKLTGYALGRELNHFDECILRDAMKALSEHEYRPAAAIETIALAKAFRFRYYPPSESSTPAPAKQ